MAIQVPPMEEKQYIELRGFMGANYNIDTTQIEHTESPDMCNMTVDNDGTLDKRTGYRLVKYLDGKINGLFEYNGSMIIVAGQKIYEYKDKEATEIYDELTDAPAVAFAYTDGLYIINGHEYVHYDGTQVLPVDPYVPIIAINAPPLGGGTVFEEWNLLGKTFEQTFNTDGVATDFYLAAFPLDDDGEVTAEHLITGTTYSEGNGLSVDTSTGKVTFSSAPTKEGDGVGELIIRANKTYDELANRILKCTRFHLFGGNNDTRIHLYGNPDFPSRMFRSGLKDPTYWPEFGFNEPGISSDAVVGRITQYDTAVIFKEGSIYLETFALDAQGGPTFPTRTLNSDVGCVAPDSIQLVNNMPIFLSSTGVYTLASSQIRDERNVQLMSEKINKELLLLDLPSAKSVTYDDRYFLFFPDGTVWVFHQLIGCWFPWEGIEATAVAKLGNRLWLGREDGGFGYLKTIHDIKPYNDDESGVEDEDDDDDDEYMYFFPDQINSMPTGVTPRFEWENTENALNLSDDTATITLEGLAGVPSMALGAAAAMIDNNAVEMELYSPLPINDMDDYSFPMTYTAGDAEDEEKIVGLMVLIEGMPADIFMGTGVPLDENGVTTGTSLDFVFRIGTEVMPNNGLYDVIIKVEYIGLRTSSSGGSSGGGQEAGKPIESYWVSKVFPIGEKTISRTHKLIAIFRPDINITAEIEYRTDRKGSWQPLPGKGFGAGLFDYGWINYATFTYVSNTMPQTISRKFKTKRIGNIQFRLKNNLLDSSMGILFLAIGYSDQKER